MQVTQAEDKNSKRVGVGEEYIKFRPSPNFKNMKKFLKHRSETDLSPPIVTALQSIATEVPQAKIQPSIQSKPSPTTAQLKEEQKKDEIKPLVVQPPLPPYPPPPSPPNLLNIKIKKEIEDPYTTEECMGSLNQALEQAHTVTKHERPKKTICKEFIRGNCKRTVCKFAHEIDTSQLTGVFTFCWQYQNAVCTYPNCRFVHATVFEEAEFYRTGVLPAHVRNHLKKESAPPPPPPPEDTQAIVSASYPIPPPPIHVGADKSVISCIPACSMDERLALEERVAALRSATPLKREWSEVDEISSSPRDLELSDNVAKKCNTCELMEFRIQYNKQKVENMLQATEEINKKMGLLTKKANKLSNVLLTLIKPSLQSSKVNNSLVGNEKDKAVLEQLTTFANSNTRLNSLLNEESVKTMFSSNTNLTTLMSKWLHTNDMNLPQDTTRET